ncbi:MAG: transposase [Thermoguttaceae bacterium]|nr:transposase [Thermoguttaceae bacterium]MDW8037427.1 transposase [Thermoguttaceae bacterium]
MFSLPEEAKVGLLTLSIAFTEPTFHRMLGLLVGMLLLRGRRSVNGALWQMQGLLPGHPSSYHRLLSRARWALWPLARLVAGWAIRLAERMGPSEGILVAVDDTVVRAKGRRVYGKGRHRDPLRSTHRHMVWRWGHRWVVLAVLVRFAWAQRSWALPVLVALYRPKQEGWRRHKTPTDLARGLMAVLIRWFPEKTFIFLADGGFSSYELAWFCRRRQAVLVGRFWANACLHEQPHAYQGRGRPRLKGPRRPSPQQVVAQSTLCSCQVLWHGETARRVQLCSQKAFWYKPRYGLTPIRWVFARDPNGRFRDFYLFCTKPQWRPQTILSFYTTRWAIETTFQQTRAQLGLETTRGWRRQTVLRTGPCLLGLFTLVCVIYQEYWERHPTQPPSPRPGYPKHTLSFSDVLAAVRKLFWEQSILAHPYWQPLAEKIPPEYKSLLLDQLCFSP